MGTWQDDDFGRDGHGQLFIGLQYMLAQQQEIHRIIRWSLPVLGPLPAQLAQFPEVVVMVDGVLDDALAPCGAWLVFGHDVFLRAKDDTPLLHEPLANS